VNFINALKMDLFRPDATHQPKFNRLHDPLVLSVDHGASSHNPFAAVKTICRDAPPSFDFAEHVFCRVVPRPNLPRPAQASLDPSSSCPSSPGRGKGGVWADIDHPALRSCCRSSGRRASGFPSAGWQTVRLDDPPMRYLTRTSARPCCVRYIGEYPSFCEHGKPDRRMTSGSCTNRPITRCHLPDIPKRCQMPPDAARTLPDRNLAAALPTRRTSPVLTYHQRTHHQPPLAKCYPTQPSRYQIAISPLLCRQDAPLPS
jgi:hypothetical protein